ncbi:RNA polymerase sigma factor [Corallococcus llansteffanensis]|uniref:Sigma-70 family RNA polymerase sigma factor n=1 Tax=Corallococcus llansteffanensis TaxID=2316731 RepID=A0A3A8QHT4_9BACT|nr:sigma-70 family RNA polymerase sigma factor [Corallococcus llansteffanensis]RKH68289.1 sigma-70 family RNA polymerase sigma factor [Corallococcus llansteffanensis]
MSTPCPSASHAGHPSNSRAIPFIPDAFWQRWRLHRPILLQQCMRMLGGQHSDAEDVVSITLLNALRQLSRECPPVVNERAWLIRILYNTCMDMHRYRRRFAGPVDFEEQNSTEEGPHTVVQDMSLSPEEVLLARERTRALDSHVQRLPPGLRTPFVMRFHQDMSYPEIAATLKLTDCNVRKRIQLAYRHLREACAETA